MNMQTTHSEIGRVEGHERARARAKKRRERRERERARGRERRERKEREERKKEKEKRHVQGQPWLGDLLRRGLSASQKRNYVFFSLISLSFFS